MKSSRNDYWELPGGGAEDGDRDSTWHSKNWATMKREWKEETGIKLPNINRYNKFNLGTKYYYVLRTSSSLSQLPSNGRLYGDGEVNRWTLMTVNDALKQRIRGDHYEALKVAKDKGYIEETESQG